MKSRNILETVRQRLDGFGERQRIRDLYRDRNRRRAIIYRAGYEQTMVSPRMAERMLTKKGIGFTREVVMGMTILKTECGLDIAFQDGQYAGLSSRGTSGVRIELSPSASGNSLFA